MKHILAIIFLISPHLFAESNLQFPVKIIAYKSTDYFADADLWVKIIHTKLGQEVRKGEVVVSIQHHDPQFTSAILPIYSHFFGVISSLHFTEDSFVQKGQKIFSILDPKKVMGVVEIPISEISQIQKSSKGILIAEKEIPFSVSAISPSADDSTGTIRCEIVFFQIHPSLLPGTIHRVKFE